MSKAKDRGTRAESAVRDWLQSNGFPHCERMAGNGALDRGDLTGLGPGIVVEVKDHARLDLAGWMNELHAEMINAKAGVGVVVHKRRGKSDPDSWYCSMPGSVLVKLLQAWAA